MAGPDYLFARQFDPEKDTAVLNGILEQIYRAQRGSQSGNTARVRLTRTTNFSHSSSGSSVAIPWTVETYDPNEMFDSAVSTTLITVQVDGIYLISAGVQIDGNNTGNRRLAILKNSGVIAENRTWTLSTVDHRMSVSTTNFFSKGDTVSLEVFQNSGGSLNIEASAAFPFIEMVKVADLVTTS